MENSKLEQEKLDAKKSSTVKINLSFETKKNSLNLEKFNLTHDIEHNKDIIHQLKQTEQELIHKITQQKSADEISRKNLLRLQVSLKLKQISLDELNLMNDQSTHKVRLVIEDIRSSRETTAKAEFRESHSEFIGTQKSFKHRLLLRSRAPGNSKKYFDPEITSDFNCKCTLF